MHVLPEHLDVLEAEVSACRVRERGRLRGQVANVRRRAAEGKPFDQSLTRLTETIERCKLERAERLANLPKPAFPQELPVAAKRTEIAKTIAENQVVVIAGETGS